MKSFDTTKAKLMTRPKNERVIWAEGEKQFMTEDDDGTMRLYEGIPPEDWPRDHEKLNGAEHARSPR